MVNVVIQNVGVTMQQEMNLLNEQNAVKFVLQQLKRIKGYTWLNIQYLNKKRYALITSRLMYNIAIIFKRDLFQSFGIKLKDKGAKGVGDSINCKHLKIFQRNRVKDIYAVFPDGKIYTIPLIDFLYNSIKWTNKEGTEVRSISVHKYERVN